MRRFTAHVGVGVLVLGGVGVGLAPSAAAGDGHPPDVTGPVVVATGLDNPRQLNWGPDRTLLVAEAGSGGDVCVELPSPEPGAPPETQCAGTTGAVTAVQHPGGHHTTAARVVDGLFSVASPDGSAAVGSNGVDATDVPGEYIVPETYSSAGIPPEFTEISGSEQLGHLLVIETDGGGQYVIPYADIAAAEEEQNPDGAQIDSNPYGVLFVDPTPDGEPGTDGYALVADAAANTVWKVEPDFSAVPVDCTDDACIPPYEITVFATYPTPADDDVTPEFVPTSLATDEAGNVYVGGLGSLQPGYAEVREYSAAGEEINAWGGFTSITGLAVDPEGEHLYVSQLFGTASDPMGAPGTVVRVDIARGTYRSVDVPFPAGVALDHKERVFVSAFSISPAGGVPASEMGPATPGGQVWQISFGGQPRNTLPAYFPHDTGGQYVPAAANYVVLGDRCGQTLAIATGDQPGEWRVTRNRHGDRIEYRGPATVDVLGQHGQVLIDELDASGSGYETIGADGSYAFSLDGPNYNYVGSDGELAAYTALGLPGESYWTSGTFAETQTPDGKVTVTSVPDDVVDLCSLLPAD